MASPQVTALQQQIVTLQSQLSALQGASDQIAQLQAELSDLQNQLAAMTAKEASDQTLIAGLTKQVADLTAQVAMVTADDASDKATISDLQQKLDAAIADDASDKATIADLRAQIDALKNPSTTTPPPAPTAVNALVTTLVLANGDVWTLGTVRPGDPSYRDLQTLRNGTQFANGFALQYLTTDGSSVYALTQYSSWWMANVSAGSWSATTDPRGVSPPVTQPPVVTPFSNQRTGKTYAVFNSTFDPVTHNLAQLGAHEDARDGDVILVQPGVYPYSVQAWGITKAVTVKSAVPGKRYVLAISRNATSGAIGSAISVSCQSRFNATQSKARWTVSVEDMEAYADGLTFVTEKCAVNIDLQSGTCPIDFYLRRSYIHDYDQGLECDNEYDPADRTSTITIENSIIYQTGGIGSGDANHSVYVGYCGALTITGSIIANRKVQASENSRYPNGWTGPVYDPGNGEIDGPNYWPVGYLVKCRAKALTINGCRLTAQDVTNSACIEMGDGGDVLITGSMLEQGSITVANSLVSYGRFYFDTNRNATYGEITSLDGRTNRLRMYQNTLVNSCPRPGQQFVEVSFKTTQAYWTSIGRTQAAPPLAVDIQNNLWVNNGTVDAFTPETGYQPTIGLSSTAVQQAWGIACPGATNNAVKHFADLVDVTKRYAGWQLSTPVVSGTARAPLSLVDVTIVDYATKSPSTVARSDSNYGAVLDGQTTPQQPPVTIPPGSSAPWYATTLLNGWSRLPFPSIYSQVQQTVADRANPDDVGKTYKGIYPFTGVDSAGYVGNDGHNGPWPYAKDAQGNPVLVAGVPPIPGYMDFRGDQGACICYNATVVRRGVTYKGTFIIWFAQGGHGVGLNNQILGYHVESGTFLDFTQQSIPPLGSIGTTPAWRPDDGRWLSTHGYNNGVFDQKRNTVIQQAGPAQVGGPGSFGATYAYVLHGDGWAGPNAVSDPSPGKDYFSAAGGASANGRNATMCVDNVADKIWNSYPNSPYVNTVAVVSADLAPGSQWRYIELLFRNGDPQLGGASCAQKALEGEPWIVYMSEMNPYRATILNHAWSAGGSGAHANNPAMWEADKRGVWNVSFAPKDGNPVNAIPTTVLTMSQIPNVDNVVDKGNPPDPNPANWKPVSGIPATWAYDFEERVIYVCVYCVDDTPLMDVYRVPLPPIDKSRSDGVGSTFVQGIGTANEIVVPWVSEKIPKDLASVIELPTRGNGTGPWYPAHNTMFFVPSPNRGLMFVHDPAKSPIFWRLS